MKKDITVCYFGISDPNLSRNAVYIKGLKENGLRVIVCIDNSSRFKKYFRLINKFLKIREEVDAIIVGYSGYIIVPLAKILSLITIRKPVIFDALCSFYETEIISRSLHKKNRLILLYVHIVDYLANHFADYILLETDKQKDFFIKRFGLKENKLVTVYTGVDDSKFYFDGKDKKFEEFTVLFRGRITAESGAIHILDAAKIIENKNIKFLIIGFGFDNAMKDFREKMDSLNLTNLEYIKEIVDYKKLREIMAKCHISLGQFSNNERLDRTIPHKVYESMAMKLPYITVRSKGITEIIKDGEDCIMTEGFSGEEIVNKILLLKNNRELRDKISENAFELYQSKFIPRKIVFPILDLVNNNKS